MLLETVRSSAQKTRWSLLVSVALGLAAPAVAGSQSPAPQWNPDDRVFTKESDRAARDAKLRDEKRQRADEAARRGESRKRYAHLRGADAIALAQDRFAATLATNATKAVKVPPGSQVTEYLTDYSARVQAGTGEGRSILYSTLPMRALSDDGRKLPIDLSLEETGAGLEPINPLVELIAPSTAAGRVELPTSKVSFRPGDATDVAGREVDGRVFYPAAVGGDVDYIVQPTIEGVEVFWQIRSEAAPEDLALDFDLAEGHRLAAVTTGSDAGSIAVEDVAGRRVALVVPPAAWDADQMDVRMTMEVDGDRILFHVAHKGRDLHYPILADPTVAENWAAGSNHMMAMTGGCGGGSLSGLWKYEEFRNGYSSPFSQTCDMRSAGLGYGAFAGSYQWGTYYDYDTSQYFWAAPPKVHIQNFFPKQVRHSVGSGPGVGSGAFAGIYVSYPNPNPRWLAYAQNNYAQAPQDPGGLYPSALEDAGSRAYFGLRMIGTGQRYYHGLAGMGGAWIQVNDNYPPTIALAQHSPTLVTSNQSGWFDPGITLPYVNLSMADVGLGLWKYSVVRDSGQVLHEVTKTCTGTKVEPRCLPSLTTGYFPLVNASTIPEGITGLHAEVVDITEKGGRSPSWTYRIDKSVPDVPTTSGPLYDNRVTTGLDGEETGGMFLAEERLYAKATDSLSGIQSLELLVDGRRLRPEHFKWRSCSSTGCPATMEDSFDLRAADLTPGDHTVTVVARDDMADVNGGDHANHRRTSTAFQIWVPEPSSKFAPEDTGEDTTPPAAIASSSSCEPQEGITDATACDQDPAVNPLLRSAVDEPHVTSMTTSPVLLGNEGATTTTAVPLSRSMQSGGMCVEGDRAKPIDGPLVNPGTRWGLSDQNAFDGRNVFDPANLAYDARVHKFGFRRIRLIIPFDLVPRARAYPADMKYQPCADYLHVRDFIRQQVSLPSPPEIVISFEKRRSKGGQDNLPGVEKYRAATEQFRDMFPAIHTFTAWNEPNHKLQPTRRRPNDPDPALENKGPVRAGAFWQSLNGRCQKTVPKCVVAAGDFLDDNSFHDTYFEKYYSGMGGKPPAIWAYHPYVAIYRQTTSKLRKFIDRPQVSGRVVWLTEAGAVRFQPKVTVDAAGNPAPQDTTVAKDKLEWFFNTQTFAKPEIRRFFYYQWYGKPIPEWDSGLIELAGGPEAPARPVCHMLIKRVTGNSSATC